MNKPRNSLRAAALRCYGLGLLCVVGGAGFTGLVGSMWPLALGSSAAVLCTVTLVRDIRGRAAARRDAARRPGPGRP